MPKLIKDGVVIDDAWTLLEADATAIPDGAVILPLSLWLQHQNELSARNQIGVCLNSDQSPRLLGDNLNKLQVIAINFPLFTDGRGFSYARELRQEHGFKGEIRAVGHFMRDQLFYLQRCGFNAFALQSNELEAALASLNDFSDSYQATIQQPIPLWKRR